MTDVQVSARLALRARPCLERVRRVTAITLSAAPFVFSAGVAQSQTISGISRLAETTRANATDQDKQLMEVAANNPWALAGQIGYKFAGPGDFADNLLVSGKTIYELPLDYKASRGWHLPIVTNFASLAADVSGGKTKKGSSGNLGITA